MRIAAFCYDFNHEKSSRNLLALACSDYRDITCFASPLKKLNIIPSPTRITPVIYPQHPRDVAKALGFKYIPIDHDLINPTMLKENYDLGIIMGARVLKPKVATAIDIINMHPGWLPENRNLDNCKWAILDRIPQAVTTHFIDEHVDRGTLIDRRICPVYTDDTMLDIFLRLQSLETIMMIEAIRRMEKWEKFTIKLGKGKFNPVVSNELDLLLPLAFSAYKNSYWDICNDFLRPQNEDSQDVQIRDIQTLARNEI